jgi:Flp pilus assembly protein TadG
MKGECCRESDGQQGSAVVEVVIVLPILMVVLFFAVQAALWAVSAELVQASASVGSEVAAGAGGSSAAGTEAVLSYLKAHEADIVGTPDVQIDRTAGDDFVYVRVSASVGGIVPGESVRVSATRVEPLQEFRESG